MSENAPSYFSQQVDQARRFYFPRGLQKTFEIESGGQEECPETYDVDRENFPHFVIEFIARGTGGIQLGRENWKLPPGSLYVYDRNLPHRISTLSRGGMTKYFVIMRGSGVRRTLVQYGLTPGRVIQMSDQARIAEIFDDLVTLGCSTRRNRSTACTATLGYLLIKIEELTISSERLVSGAYSAYLKCLRQMQSHCLKFTSIKEVALACGVNPAYLCRLFGRFSREKPYACLIRLRMEHAARELRHPEKTVKAVAEELGFSDPASFSRAFKRTLGVSPANSRRPLSRT